MTTGIASGLGTTVGWALESAVGTITTPTVWVPHNKADFQLKKTPVQSRALRGSRFLEATRRNILQYTVDGTLDLDLATTQMGKLFQAAMNAAGPTTTNLADTAYLQSFLPGFLEGVGSSLTVQKGIPALPGGTIQAFTYNGCKITDWTLTVQRGGLANFTCTLDGWNAVTSTSYTSPTYLSGASAPALFDFTMGTLLTGGALTESNTVLTTSSGSAPTGVVSEFSIKGTNHFDVTRFPLGASIKKEQVTNAFTEITGDFTIEYANLTDYYTPFVADTTEPLLFTLASSNQIGSTGDYPTVQVAISAAKYEEGAVSETGEGLIVNKVPFTALDDGNGNTFQIQYVTTDTTP